MSFASLEEESTQKQVVLRVEVAEPLSQTPLQLKAAQSEVEEELGDQTEVVFVHNNYLFQVSARLLRSVLRSCKNLVKLVRFASRRRASCAAVTQPLVLHRTSPTMA